ncbi:hypothetical protein BGX26_012479 [Mortierella sp. AD094]|nr:hypothetical protein BGX26_012479 [Mortierella sp. AD094]
MIHSLVFRSDFPHLYTTVYPKLQTLGIHSNTRRKSPLPKGGLVNLLDLNSSLTRINIDGSLGYLTAHFWKAVSRLPNMKTLQLHRVIIDEDEEVEAFWLACTELENLYLFKCIFSSVVDTTTTMTTAAATAMTFPRMRSLRVDICMHTIMQVNLISRFPQLEELVWRFYTYDSQVLAEFATNLARQDAWPLLHVLSIGYVADECLGPILKGMKRATKLDLSYNDFGPLSFRELGRHFDTLESLNLVGCRPASSIMLCEIMCSCPRLEVLNGDSILAKDVVERGPWVCLLMRELRVRFDFGEADKHLEPLILVRLSSLVRLDISEIANWK